MLEMFKLLIIHFVFIKVLFNGKVNFLYSFEESQVKREFIVFILNIWTGRLKKIGKHNERKMIHLTKTRLFKYIENFSSKNLKFSDKL